MFTEAEVDIMVNDEVILADIKRFKKEFLKEEAQFLEISDHDFLSLVLMTPKLSLALADGKISFNEEMALNRKARKLSKGGYFMKRDPVVVAMKFLIQHFDRWESEFLDEVKLIMNRAFDHRSLAKHSDEVEAFAEGSFRRAALNTPYVVIRFLSSFFLQEDEHILLEREIKASEFERLKKVGAHLGLNDLAIYRMFCESFKIK